MPRCLCHTGRPAGMCDVLWRRQLSNVAHEGLQCMFGHDIEMSVPCGARSAQSLTYGCGGYEGASESLFAACLQQTRGPHHDARRSCSSFPAPSLWVQNCQCCSKAMARWARTWARTSCKLRLWQPWQLATLHQCVVRESATGTSIEMQQLMNAETCLAGFV